MKHLTNGWIAAATVATMLVLLDLLGVLGPDLRAGLAMLAHWEDSFSVVVGLVSLLTFGVGSATKTDGFRPNGEGTPEAGADVRVMASRLLLEVAHADGCFSSRERRYVEETLEEQFGLDRRTAAAVLRRAEDARADGPSTVRHTQELRRRLSHRQRLLLQSILCRLAGLEGEPNRNERYTVQKLSALLRVESSRLCQRMVGDSGRFATLPHLLA